MKASKTLGVVLSLHLGVAAVLITQPGCQTSQPPTQTYQQDRTNGADSGMNVPSTRSNGSGTRTSVQGALRSSSELMTATRLDEGSSLDAAFNAGMEGDDSVPDNDIGDFGDFGDFGDVAPLEPILPPSVGGPTVSVAGSSFETYSVKRGDSLWAISKRYSVSLNELYTANSLNKNSVLKIGQQIQIPVEGGSATVRSETADTYQPTSLNSGSESYTVKRGDTLSKIASQFNSSVRSIKATNGRTSDLIRVGETLIIPVGSTSTGSTSLAGSSASASRATSVSGNASAATVPSVTSGSSRTHKVQSGEFPVTIARKYGMTSSELLELNGITDPRSLQIGQVLNVNASGNAANVDSRTDTFKVAQTAASIPTTLGSAPARSGPPAESSGPIQIRVVEADPLVEGEVDIIDVDSQFNNAIEIPVIRLDQ